MPADFHRDAFTCDRLTAISCFLLTARVVKTASMSTAKRDQKDRRRRAVPVQHVMDVLGPEYGPAEWKLRYDPASELVSTILSQHTSDINSGRAFESLMAEFGSLEAVARGPVERVQHAIRMGGLAKTKAPRIMAVLQMVEGEVGSYDLSFLREMPLDEAKAWLKRLPGIGPKTAAIVLCFSMGLPAMPVDTHIHRVAKRLGLVGPKITAEKAHDILESKVPPDDVFPFHMYLIRHGRAVCKAQRPQCERCVLADVCPSQPAFERSERRKRKARTRAA